MNGELNPALRWREAISWRVLTEVLRRYPRDFRFHLWHPGGGQYDQLSLFPSAALPSNDPRPRIDLNRAGSAHIFSARKDRAQWSQFWSEALQASDAKAIVDKITDLAGLQPIRKLPAASAQAVFGRVVAAIVGAAALDRVHWDCVMGYEDSSGDGGGLLEALFDNFPVARRRLNQGLETDPYGEPGFRFWFVRKDEQPLVAFELHPDSVTAWTLEGTEHDLLSLYRAGKPSRVWPIVFSLVGDELE